MCFHTPTYSSLTMCIKKIWVIGILAPMSKEKQFSTFHYSFSHFQYYGSQLTVLYTSTTPHPIASHSEVIQFLNLVSTDGIILKGHPRPERQHRWLCFFEPSLPPSVNTLSHMQFFQWRVGRCQDSHMKTWGILTERDLHQRDSFPPSEG